MAIKVVKEDIWWVVTEGLKDQSLRVRVIEDLTKEAAIEVVEQFLKKNPEYHYKQGDEDRSGLALFTIGNEEIWLLVELDWERPGAIDFNSPIYISGAGAVKCTLGLIPTIFPFARINW